MRSARVKPCLRTACVSQSDYLIIAEAILWVKLILSIPWIFKASRNVTDVLLKIRQYRKITKLEIRMGTHTNISFTDFPEQGSWLGKQFRICFNYDTTKTLTGICVRNDREEPGRTIFKLDDGRYVLSTECQCQPL